MDGTIVNVAIYLTATFAAALVTGVAGFAFGLVAAVVWLHILTPLQTATSFPADAVFEVRKAASLDRLGRAQDRGAIFRLLLPL